MQCTNYLPGYYHPKDLNGILTGNSWPVPQNDITWNSATGYAVSLPPIFANQNLESVHRKEILKQTILKHEAIFRYQVNELHRVYRRQRELMDEVRRKKLVENHLHLQTFESKSFVSQERPEVFQKTHWPLVDLTSIEPSATSNTIAGAIVQPSAGSVAAQNVLKEWKMSSSKSSQTRKRMLDLELPAEEYVDSEDDVQYVEESPAQGSNILNSVLEPRRNFVSPEDSSISNSSRRDTFLLFDLNEPAQPDETGHPNSDLQPINIHEEISNRDQAVHSDCSTPKNKGGVGNLNSCDEVSSGFRTPLSNQTASLHPRSVETSLDGTKSDNTLIVSPRKRFKGIAFAVQALPYFIDKSPLSITGKRIHLYHSSDSSQASGTSGSCLMRSGDNDHTPGQADTINFSKFSDTINSAKGMDLNCTPSDLSEDQFSATPSNVSHLNLCESAEREICEKSVVRDCIIMNPDSSLECRTSTGENTLVGPEDDSKLLKTDCSFNLSCIKEEAVSSDPSKGNMTAVDRDLEAPVSPENKEGSPPRGDSQDNLISTPVQWSKSDQTSDCTGEPDRAAAETLFFISSFGNSKTAVDEPSEATRNSLSWLADIATSLASRPKIGNEKEVLCNSPSSQTRRSRQRSKNYQKGLKTEELAAASVSPNQLTENFRPNEDVKLLVNASSESRRCRKTQRRACLRSGKWPHNKEKTICSLLQPHSSTDKQSTLERLCKGWGITKGRQNGRRARSYIYPFLN